MEEEGGFTRFLLLRRWRCGSSLRNIGRLVPDLRFVLLAPRRIVLDLLPLLLIRFIALHQGGDQLLLILTCLPWPSYLVLPGWHVRLAPAQPAYVSTRLRQPAALCCPSLLLRPSQLLHLDHMRMWLFCFSICLGFMGFVSRAPVVSLLCISIIGVETYCRSVGRSSSNCPQTSRPLRFLVRVCIGGCILCHRFAALLCIYVLLPMFVSGLLLRPQVALPRAHSCFPVHSRGHSPKDSCPVSKGRGSPSLLPRVFEVICGVFGHSHLDLFVTHKCKATSLHLLCSGSDGLEAGRFPTPLGPPVGLHLSTLCSSYADIIESSAFDRVLVDSGGSILATETVVSRSSVPAG